MFKAGVVGVGNIGQGLVHNLLSKGYETHLYAPRSHEDIAAMAARGGVLHYDLAELGACCDMVFIAVFSADQVREVALGDGGLFASMPAGGAVAVCSTIDPSVLRELDAEASRRGLSLIDCPVSGGRQGASNGSLLLMAACPDEVFAQYQEVHSAVGGHVRQVGKQPGLGQIAKATVQIMVSLNALVASEALVLGTKAGLDPELLLDILTHSYGTSRVLEEKAPVMLERDFHSTGGLNIHVKDLDVGLRLGRELEVPLFLSSLARELYVACEGKGWGREDFCAVLKLYEEIAGVEFIQKEKLNNDQKKQ